MNSAELPLAEADCVVIYPNRILNDSLSKETSIIVRPASSLGRSLNSAMTAKEAGVGVLPSISLDPPIIFTAIGKTALFRSTISKIVPFSYAGSCKVSAMGVVDR